MSTLIEDRIRLDNPWWKQDFKGLRESSLPKRGFFKLFYQGVTQKKRNRAVVLLGPRRVGKTVMLYQAIIQLMANGVAPNKIYFASLQTPAYLGEWPETLLNKMLAFNGLTSPEGCYFFFDEVQYFKDWSLHFKVLVDTFPTARFIVSGSAAAALKMASTESGTGRFTNFALPPLLFYEYLNMTPGLQNKFTLLEGRGWSLNGITKSNGNPTHLAVLNRLFLNYIHYGGFPELVYNPGTLAEDQRILKEEIINSALQRDLPVLYGIENVQEVYKLLAVFARQTGMEFRLEKLSMESGLDKDTIKKYITFLEAAYLIKVVHRVDANGKSFKRNTAFKVYLSTTSIRTGLMGEARDDTTLGHLVESAIFAQASTLHSNIYYARWEEGKKSLEIDLLLGDSPFGPFQPYEIKWIDNITTSDLNTLINYALENNESHAIVTTKTIEKQESIRGVSTSFIPSAVCAAIFGFVSISHRQVNLDDFMSGSGLYDIQNLDPEGL